VAEILAWAEAQHPATPEAWGLKVPGRAAETSPAARESADLNGSEHPEGLTPPLPAPRLAPA
jgi:hypothetical protein